MKKVPSSSTSLYPVAQCFTSRQHRNQRPVSGTECSAAVMKEDMFGECMTKRKTSTEGNQWTFVGLSVGTMASVGLGAMKYPRRTAMVPFFVVGAFGMVYDEYANRELCHVGCHDQCTHL